MNWVYLSLAIVSEVVATSFLPVTKGFARIGPSLLVMGGYAGALYLLSLTLRSIPVGVAYAIWAGSGVALVTLLAWVVHGQKLDIAALGGIALIVAGVVILNLFSRTATH